MEALRPSGCSSYDPPQGGDGLTASPLSGNIWYNYWRNISEYLVEGGDDDDGSGSAKAAAAAAAIDGTGDYKLDEDPEFRIGRVIRQCVGFPPPYRLDRASDPFDTLTVDDGLAGAFEDEGVGTTVRLACPTSCLTAEGDRAGSVRGSPKFYTDDSAVCMAAVHAGVLTTDSAMSPMPLTASSTWSSSGPALNGDASEKVIVVIARLISGNISEAEPVTRLGSEANNVSAGDAPVGWARGFGLEAALPAEITVQTVAGRPAGALGEGCGDIGDGQPPQEAVFGRPVGIDAWRSANLTEKVKKYPGR